MTDDPTSSDPAAIHARVATWRSGSARLIAARRRGGRHRAGRRRAARRARRSGRVGRRRRRPRASGPTSTDDRSPPTSEPTPSADRPDGRPRRRRGGRSSSAPATSATAPPTSDSRPAALLDDIEGTVFTAGDNAYENGTAAEFATCYDAVVGPPQGPDPARARQPRLATRATWTATSATSARAARARTATRGTRTTSGTWHVDRARLGVRPRSMAATPTPTQGRWLAADLAASDATLHDRDLAQPALQLGRARQRPVGRAVLDGSCTPPASTSIVNGHDHDYERFAPQDPDRVTRTATRGIRQFVVGHRRHAAARRSRSPSRTASCASVAPRRAQAHAARRRATTGSSSRSPATSATRGTAFCH